MGLPIGSRVGSYQVTASIGSGGMGEVYRARDTRLNRDVALKVLPETFSRDPDRLARFEREAQVLASLSHPNIAGIYGVEEISRDNATMVGALVLELVEGPTLADRIAQGPVPLDEALPLARQIAEALEAAHDSGIVHRDLKPANIKLRPDGSVKVLDFGLAKALEPAAAPIDMTVSPTMASPGVITGVGTLLGTPAYMSPEQARGKPVDRRSDIWAFGCVLFEMLTGRRAFDGDSGPDMLARVIEREPEFSALPPGTPPSITRLLRRALAKDPRMRLPDIAMARLEIAAAMTGEEQAVVTTPGSRLLWRRSALPWALAVLSTVTALAVLWAWQRAPAAVAGPATPLDLNLPPGVELYGGTGQSVCVSRDGTRTAYIGSVGGQRKLYVRRTGPMGRPETEEFSGPPEGPNLLSCFFSWDGNAVGFITADRILGKVILDHITFGRGGALWQVPASGGSAPPMPLTTLDRDGHEIWHGWPSIADDGARILFTVMTDKPHDPQSIWALSVATRKRDLLEDAATFPLYALSGHLPPLQRDARRRNVRGGRHSASRTRHNLLRGTISVRHGHDGPQLRRRPRQPAASHGERRRGVEPAERGAQPVHRVGTARATVCAAVIGAAQTPPILWICSTRMSC